MATSDRLPDTEDRAVVEHRRGERGVVGQARGAGPQAVDGSSDDVGDHREDVGDPVVVRGSDLDVERSRITDERPAATAQHGETSVVGESVTAAILSGAGHVPGRSSRTCGQRGTCGQRTWCRRRTS
ncbi:hypothetical protein [Blastococcus brunescens]|uniref:Uncharacterized protein n=1 Tax=Blastococcus brunescens TaxID=1564165 RepID=A0ABZ1B900_9ACTN|nr:hypothetical protein [Blastococcus sp. BMG 8361]WRL67303.1 hypothetical protein U6N30_23540 [Blastococcus sp. BMG 8361]